MKNTTNSLEKKITRKQKRCQHILEKETGITPCERPSKVNIRGTEFTLRKQFTTI